MARERQIDERDETRFDVSVSRVVKKKKEEREIGREFREDGGRGEREEEVCIVERGKDEVEVEERERVEEGGRIKGRRSREKNTLRETNG